ncbi:hypothetical protein DdX_19982 [Ditylenchus destructor]|uniref:Uncharacterized protein n=1 Tax=Ditylenchus destructor TaxID=166010 RepID=A0AAD4MHY7_9BILA|nr:hypothetical protein DdX_19982 [Ditylenchus destructor]
MFDKEVTTEEYNEWIARNGYSKKVPVEGQIAGNESTENGRVIYTLWANIYQNPNNRQDIATTVFEAYVELKDETWPLFQHLIRLLMDPLIYIRSLSLFPQMEVLNLLTEAMNPDRDRLQCKQLKIHFNDDSRKFVAWIKDYVRCDEFEIYGNKEWNYDEELLNLFLTGAPCTTAINVITYDLLNVIVDLVQIFMGLKNREEYQLIESIRGKFNDQGALEEFKRNLGEFIAEEGQYEEGRGIMQVVGFINNDIDKKLTLRFQICNVYHSLYLGYNPEKERKGTHSVFKQNR